MNNRILLIAALSVSMFSYTGCDKSPSRHNPDSSVNTSKRAEDIKQNGQDQKDAIDAKAILMSNKLELDERLIREKYKAKRHPFVDETAKEEANRDAKNRDVQILAKREKDAIDTETSNKLKTSLPEKAADIQADAGKRKSDIDTMTSIKMGLINQDAADQKEKNIQRDLEMDQNESKEIRALEQERTMAKIAMADKKLKVDIWTNDELAKIEKESSSAK